MAGPGPSPSPMHWDSTVSQGPNEQCPSSTKSHVASAQVRARRAWEGDERPGGPSLAYIPGGGGILTCSCPSFLQRRRTLQAKWEGKGAARMSPLLMPLQGFSPCINLPVASYEWSKGHRRGLNLISRQRKNSVS